MNLRDDEGVATVLACCVLAAIVMVTGGMLYAGSCSGGLGTWFKGLLICCFYKKTVVCMKGGV